MVAQWIKENKLPNVLEEPADDRVIINALKISFDNYKNLGESHARGVLYSKRLKVNQTRLRNVLRIMKGTIPLRMRLIKRIEHSNRSANTVRYLNTMYKLIKHKLIVSGMSDG